MSRTLAVCGKGKNLSKTFTAWAVEYPLLLVNISQCIIALDDLTLGRG